MQYTCFDQSLIYVIEDDVFNKEMEHKTQAQKDIYISNPNVETTFYLRARRFNKEKLKVVLQISGVKDHFVFLVVDKVFQGFIDMGLTSATTLKKSFKRSNSELNKQNELKAIMTNRSFFNSILQKNLKEHSPWIEKKILSNFELSCDLVEQRMTVIILLGGTSGTGKSSVSSLLGSRLGIATVLSSDTTRHILRNFLDKDSCPLLFASTYECGHLLKGEEFEKMNEKEKIVKGYQEQCRLVQERLEKVIDAYQKKGESFVIEGVHLTPDFMVRMSKKYRNCLPFTLYISNENKHKERFAVRSKYMTLDEGHNKYVANFQNIRRIQKYFIKKTDKYLIPKIDNTNIDKSMGLIHKTIISYIKSHIDCFRKSVESSPSEPVLENPASFQAPLDPANESKLGRAEVLPLYEIFNKVSKNVWSTKAVKEYITSKANKTDVYERFFKDHEENPVIHYEGEIEDSLKVVEEKPDEEERKTSLGMSAVISPDEIAEPLGISRTQSLKGTPVLAIFKEDIKQIEISAERGMSSGDKSLKEEQKKDSLEIPSVVKVKQDKDKSLNPTESPRIKDEEPSRGIKHSSSSATVHSSIHNSKMKIKLNGLKELISRQQKLSINIKISRQSLRKILHLLSDINELGDSKETLKLYRTNKRYIIYKFTQNEMEDPAQLKSIIKENTKNNTRYASGQKKNLLEHKDEKPHADNYSEGSVEEVNDQIEEDWELEAESNVSGSMEMNFQGKSFRGNYSEKHDISDNDSWRIDEEDHLADINSNENNESEIDSVATQSEGSGDSEHENPQQFEKGEPFIMKAKSEKI